MKNNYFEFFITSKEGMVIITLVGEITPDAKNTLNTCISEINQYSEEMGIIYVRDLSNISEDSFLDLKRFIDQLREKFKTNFSICSLKPTLRVILQNQNISQKVDFTNNLKDTVIDFLSKSSS